MQVKPADFMEQFRTIAHESFQNVIDRMNQSFHQYLNATGQPKRILPWQVNIKMFRDLFQEAATDGGEAFHQAFTQALVDIGNRVNRGEINLVESSFEMIEICLQYINDKSPLVVIGISPPYYPAMTNHQIPALSPKVTELSQKLNSLAEATWGQTYVTKQFYTGISDLSYSALTIHPADTATVSDNMPLWGKIYQIPFDAIQKNSMPCINIGPWGKDFHKITERVLNEDLYQRTPALVDFAIKHILTEGT